MSESPSSPRLADVSALKIALMAQKVRAQSEAVLRADPIAIIGMGCRFPGGADSPEAFWELLANGVDAVRPVPADRWNADALYDADPSAPGKIATKWGGFLDRIDGFDAAYFNILPREAERMDPQQRLFLEVAMESLDDAGLTREMLRGSRTGAFVASYHNDYQLLEYRDHEAIDARTLTGTVHSVLVNRLSYLLDLRGPSISVDTACSSSLVAIHLACQSLRHGESDVALAGGVSLMVTPDLMVSLSKVGFMAPDGRCKTFDESADGFGRGEGCGVIVLKRLSDAIADGDRVLAVVRGSAVNQDGHSTLLAAPNGLAQQDLIREALASAQLAPGRISFIEAHGTGTPLGDPIEVEALAATVGRQEAGSGTCWLGAAKANLAHMEAAAGVAGVIKTVLAMRHQAIPPQIHFKSLNKHLSLVGTRLAVATRLTPWPMGELTRCAGTSGFGVGGTNAHVVLEEAPRIGGESGSTPALPHLLHLSAQSTPALRALAQSWSAFLPRSEASLTDLCFTAGARRSPLDQRLALQGRTREELANRLDAFLCDGSAPGLVTGQVSAEAAPRLAFVFSGQGPQWFAMGRELLAEEPVFRAAMTECDALVSASAGWSLLGELSASEQASRLGDTEIAQPALFAIQVSLAALWAFWGIRPDGVVGHSVGEIAALQVAGVLSLADAVRVVCHRGRVMQQATGTGRMAAVDMSAQEGARLVAPLGDRLTVAAMNGPRSIVLSGEPAALEDVLANLTLQGVNHRMLPVNYAFHSAQMAPFQRELVALLGALPSALPAVPVYSTVLGGPALSQRFDAAYFGRNVREPVRLHEAIVAMADDGFTTFLEIGPHPVLSATVTDSLETSGHKATVAASLRRGKPERETLLTAAAALHVVGHSLDMASLMGAGEVVELPRYPWQRKRFWLRPTPAPTGSGLPSAPRTSHPLLGVRLASAATTARVHQGQWTVDSAGGLRDHRIGGRLLMPAAAMLETLNAALHAGLNGAQGHLEAFVVERPLFLSEEGVVSWQVVVHETAGVQQLELHQAQGPLDAAEVEWLRICTATGRSGVSTPTAPEVQTDLHPVDREAFYDRFEALGVAFGPVFRSVWQLECGPGVARGLLQLPEEAEVESSRFGLHPALLDGALQLCAAAVSGASEAVPSRMWAPMGLDRFELLCNGVGRLRATARVRADGSAGTLAADVQIEDESGALVAHLDNVRFALTEARLLAGDAADDWLYDLQWQEAAPANPRTGQATGTWLLLADSSGTSAAVRAALQARGGHVVEIVPGEALARLAPDRWAVDPRQPGDLAALLQESGVTKPPLRGVVHLWSLDSAGADAAGADEADLLASGALLHLAQTLVAREVTVPVWLFTRAAQSVLAADVPSSVAAAAAWGFLGVLRVEHPELPVRAIDLDAHDAGASALMDVLMEAPGGVDLAWRGGRRYRQRLVAHRGTPAKPAELPLQGLEVVRPGTLDGLEIRPLQAKSLRPGDLRVRVAVTGLNFRDVLVALGVYPGTGIPLGAECAGTVVEVGDAVTTLRVGDAVFGFAHDSMGSEVVVAEAFMARTPAGLSAEQAAALPVAFLTAHHGLHGIAGLQRGQRVLIHAAAGGVGLAAVQLALRAGAEVFATAGSDAKREHLLSMGVSHVLDSRSTAFAETVMRLTQGEGVHVVLNSLAGDFIPAGLSTVAAGGWFLELGKREIWTPAAVAERYATIRYRAYDLGNDANAQPSLVAPLLADVLAGLDDGSLAPLPVTSFALSQAADAFRYMAQARHIGKIVLRMPGQEAPLVRADASYLVTGGLGALGLHTARWLAGSGARHLVLLGRRAPSVEAEYEIGSLREAGVEVRVVSADAADRVAMSELLGSVAKDMPPLRGVVHAAGSLDDGILVRQSWARCTAVLHNKVRGAQVLHELTTGMSLDFFVLYSAAGQYLGAPGQSAYAAANAALDALARIRHAQGLPGLSVAWGAWAQGGMATQMAASGHDPWSERGLGKIEPASGFERLERLLREGVAHAVVLPIDWVRFLARLPKGMDASFFPGQAARGDASTPAASAGVSVVDRIRALPSGQRQTALTAHLTERTLHVLGLDAGTAIDSHKALKEVGLDSLMAVELRNALTRSVEKPLPATLLFDYPNLAALANYLMRSLALQDEMAATPRMNAPKAGDNLADLSDEEAEALLMQELSGGTEGAPP